MSQFKEWGILPLQPRLKSMRKLQEDFYQFLQSSITRLTYETFRKYFKEF